MKNKDIKDIVKSRRYYLNKIEAKRIDKKPDEAIKMSQQTEYEIIENKDGKLSIKLNTKIFMEPESLFSIKTEHIIEYMLEEPISNEEVEKNIDILLNPLGGELSYIISTISKEMINTRIILPPKLEFKEE
ncbi:MAG TPA: hypothetical protein GX396_03410 [Tissierellia bacterium]|nr:hypothetical protein [Tissierellia bacterium]